MALERAECTSHLDPQSQSFAGMPSMRVGRRYFEVIKYTLQVHVGSVAGRKYPSFIRKVPKLRLMDTMRCQRD